MSVEKTRLFIIVMSLVYFIVSILQFCNIINLPKFYSFALSFSAILISISEVILNIAKCYFAKISISVKIFNIYNKLKLDTENKETKINGMSSEYFISIYNKYCKKEYNEDNLRNFKFTLNILRQVSLLIFALGIAVFLIFPFINNYEVFNKIQGYSSAVTTLAFSTMSLNWFFIDKLSQLLNILNELKEIFANGLFITESFTSI